VKKIAVQGFSYSISNGSVPGIQATVLMTGTPSAKGLKPGGPGICKDGYTFTVTNVLVPTSGATIPDPGPYNKAFNATAQKARCENKFVLREDDISDTISATPQIPGSPNVSFPVSFCLKIVSAGQNSVSSN
jgi:hypothetical protein